MTQSTEDQLFRGGSDENIKCNCNCNYNSLIKENHKLIL